MKFSSFSPKKSSPQKSAAMSSSPEKAMPENLDSDQISPELVPIVTLLSAQTHRRYHEGTFMLYSDLNGDGHPAEREWKEVYGILTGNQLAYWDAGNLARFQNSPEQLFQASSKPNYLNFTDAVFNAMKVLPAAKLQLENVLIVSTTLKNRFIIQLKTFESLREWTSALRLASYEYQSLQEAYTGALLSARGSRLSDIRTILAQKRFNHEDWVKIRYGSGMAWKRCYAVIEPSQSKKKVFIPGRVLLYDSEHTKKKGLVGVITSATSITAVYPQSPFFIDKSTIMKLEGSINFRSPKVKQSKKNDADSQETSLFLMPESHSSVPGFDTLIRFLIPLYDTFGLYGRPQRLKADRVDPESLVFGLPTLPHVHYLNSSDLDGILASPQFVSWDARLWKENIKNVLRSKMSHGYDGCGSSRGFSGAVSSLNSPALSPGSPRVVSASSTFQHPPQQNHQHQQNQQNQQNKANQVRSASGPLPALRVPLESHGNGIPGSGHAGGARVDSLPSSTLKSVTPVQSSRNVNNLELRTSPDSRGSVQLADIYHKYSTIETPSDRFNDRNKILNGSAEEIDEEVLPSLMRKKSLMHGPYPTSDKHLIDSESGSDSEEEESEEGSADSFPRGHGKGLLAVPKAYENRNSSYSSVHSPLTQYNEFNQQFSKSVDHRGVSKLNSNDSESEISESDVSGSDQSDYESSSPPAVPSHGPYPRSTISPVGQAQQLPQIQQLQSLHSTKQYNTQPLTPSSGEKFDTEQIANVPAMARQDISVQKSKAARNLSSNLEGHPEQHNKPRYIQSPAAAQNRSPRDFARTNGTFSSSPLDDRSLSKSPQMQQQPFERQSQPAQPAKQQQQHPKPYYDAQPQSQSQHAQRPQQTFQGSSQPHHQPQRKPPAQQYPPMQQRPQQESAQYQERAPQQYYDSKPGQGSQYYDSKPAQNTPQQYYDSVPRGSQPSPQQYKSAPQSAQQNYGQANSRPDYGQHAQQAQPKQSQGHQQQQMPQQPMAQQQMAHQARPVAQSHGDQRQPHPYSTRVISNEQKQPGQNYPLNRQPMQQTGQNLPPRPHPQQQQSAQSIRSYGEQQYQYQVQPNFQPGQRQQPQQRPEQDPRAQNPSSHGYMRQY